MTRFVRGPVRVRVPATSANLGPGFDALGLAHALYDVVVAEVVASGLEIEVHGEGMGSVARDDAHLVVRSMRRAFDLLGARPPGLRLHCTNEIPHGRGLGSSAAAIVAGVSLARGLVLDGADTLSDADLVALASDIEGHPDNVAPCLLGGATVAWTEQGRSSAMSLALRPEINSVLFVPPFESSTQRARGLLPATVPHGVAAANAARAALLVAALTAAPQHLLPATVDQLHQDFRAAAMPESAGLVAQLRAAGHAAVISGAGPTVLVLTDGGADLTNSCPPGWTMLTPAVESSAVRAERVDDRAE